MKFRKKEKKNISISSNEDMKSSSFSKKKIILLGYLKEGVNAVYSTCYRFPLAILLFAIFAALGIYRVHMPYDKMKDLDDILNRIMAVIALGIPLTLSVDLYFERFKKNIKPSIKSISYIVEVAILVIYFYFFIPNMDNMIYIVRLSLLTSAMLITFLFIPYLLHKKNFEVYITKVMTQITTAMFFTVVLALGISAVLFAVQSLLYSNLSSNSYIYTWILAWTIFAPIYFLYQLPKNNDIFNRNDYNKILKIVLSYIILPVMTAYTLVLYIYFAKVIITKVWPVGIVSYLVISYTAVGIASIFLLTPLRERDKWINAFISTFTKLIFPLLIMMFISIGIRINEFGITENRYFVVVIGIWSLLAMIFHNINKGKKNIILPISLAIIITLTAVGPWSAFSVSKASQSRRLYKILSKYDMVQDGEVVNNSSDLDKKDKIEVSEILRYFRRNHEITDFKYLPKDFRIDQMEEVFGFPEQSPVRASARLYYHYSTVRDIKKPLGISEYDIFFQCEAFSYQDKGRDEKDVIFESIYIDNDTEMKAVIDKEYKLLLMQNDVQIYSYDLKLYVKELYEKYGENYRADQIDPDDLVIINSNDDTKIMLSINNVSGYLDAGSEEFTVESINADILVKVER